MWKQVPGNTSIVDEEVNVTVPRPDSVDDVQQAVPISDITL